MNSMEYLFSLAGQLLLAGVLITLLLGKFVQAPEKLRAGVAVLLVVLMLIPVNGLSVAQWLRSVTGDLSVLMLVVLSNILVQRLFAFKLLDDSSRLLLLLGIILAGTLLYPFALGLGAVDSYHFGYAPVAMSVMLALLSIVCWYAGKRDLAVVLLLPLLAFNLQLLETSNLWDYVLDPVLFVYALIQTVSYWWKNRLIKGA